MAAPALYTQADFHREWCLRNQDIGAMARTARADLMLRYFDIRLSTGAETAEWAPFQIKVLNETATFSSYNKSRQIGMSFILAGDAEAEAILTPRHTEIMISYNIEEAKEKILYAKAWWDAKHPRPDMVPARGEYSPAGTWLGRSPNRMTRWPEIVKLNALEIMFDNGSRLISHPSRPPRGKSASVIGDEAAHAQNFNAIYQAAVPMISRGHNKRIKLASTPKGASGRWWEIHTNAGNKYKDFVRHDCGWWEISELCHDINGARRAVAGGIDLDELVVRFGTGKMRMIRNSQLEEDYLQEYGLVFLDSIHAFLSWELIRACHPPELRDKLDLLYSMVDGEEPDFSSGRDVGFDAGAVQAAQDDGYFYRIARCRNGAIDIALEAIRDMREWIRRTNPDGAFGWAYDIGRDRDAAEITVFQYSGNRAMQRLMITMPQLHSDLQEAVIRALMNDIPISCGLMDQTGIGRLMADRLTSQYGYERVTPAWFTPGNKDRWAVNLKLEMQRRRVSLIPDRDQDQQLHSIKRTLSATARVFTFEVEDDSSADSTSTKKEHHHADKFWTVAMAVYLGIQYQEGKEPVGGGAGEARSATAETLEAIAEKGHRTTGQVGKMSNASTSKSASIMNKIRRKTR